jgi:hypothetical protein
MGKAKRAKPSCTQKRKQIKFPIFAQMLKKRATILFLTLAYAILLGHNIIPHHHHDTEHDLTEHHQTSHNHDSEKDSEDLSHILSHFIHSSDGFTFTVNHNISNTLSQQLFLLFAVLPDNFSVDEFIIPPLLHKPPAEHFIYISPHSLSSGLRAPPAFIG